MTDLERTQWQLKTGGPAFPAIVSPGEGFPGMTARDYFAIHASDLEIGMILSEARADNTPANRIRARWDYADRMLAEREK